MKTIGILGGMSSTSTQLYYKILCELTQKQFGELNSPSLLIRSVNFDPIAKRMADGRWDEIGNILNVEAKKLSEGGAELLLLASNTMHKMTEQMMFGVDIPLLHIADVTISAILDDGITTPAFLATKFTMDERFYIDKLESSGLVPILPNELERFEINRIIFEELVCNDVIPSSKQFYVDVVQRLKSIGADSVILGCTEVSLLLNEDNTNLPTFDTTYLHCKAAMKIASD